MRKKRTWNVRLNLRVDVTDTELHNMLLPLGNALRQNTELTIQYRAGLAFVKRLRKRLRRQLAANTKPEAPAVATPVAKPTKPTKPTEPKPKPVQTRNKPQPKPKPEHTGELTIGSYRELEAAKAAGTDTIDFFNS